MQYIVVHYTGVLEPLLTFNLSLSLFSLSRQSCWVVMDRTWWQEVITGLWRCGRHATSNSFTSTQAVTQASVPWISHTTRGKADCDRQCHHGSQTPGCVYLKEDSCWGTWVTLKENFSQTSNNVPTLENIHWLNHYDAKKLVFICTWRVWQSVCSALRTLITGMASGSIVAFNIDFNRWHYEHQNRYWGGQHEEEEDRKRREKQVGEEVMHSAVYLRRRGNYRHQEEVRTYRTLGFIPLFTWCEDAAALGEHTSSIHTRVTTDT